MPLDTIQTIFTRYSCRDFTDRTPSDEDLQTIVKAATAAPSGMNRQLWRVIVVKNRELIDDMEAEAMRNLAQLPDQSMLERIMERGGKLFYNSPCLIVLPVTIAERAGAELLDCGIVTENIALAATSLGINNLICGLAAFAFAGTKGPEFKKRLGFPEGYEIGMAVLLGYAAIPGGQSHELNLSKISFIE
jgi:nitroreductase